ncbi:putative RNA pseudouridine synthase [Methylacidimicrobium cyclopophantes]|uniref:RNA pseudouridine synthase n=1 Tax=Methylacidimicrobium cyclopophantes TaxID=1041766 RepID=A0A5E6MHW2_9BACT|nr:RluA family pseudouridine synthase [Methylacidimicrobium cyclopophantes]VVM07489.1 putative RNA pseudouridine synthase [Methylacidimicrobium cyclopophantes]
MPQLTLKPPYPPRIVFENDDFLVVDKPPFLLSHPTRRNDRPSVLSWLTQERNGASFFLANRLDRETSGLVLVGKDAAAASALGRLMEKRLIEKEYLAIVWGRLACDFLRIDAPLGYIGISEGNPVAIRQGIRAEGAPAITVLRSLCSGEEVSLLRAFPKTGRLHQIRVHLSAIRHPVVGDKIYGPDPNCFLQFAAHGWTPELAERLCLNRHALHASRLSFRWQGKEVAVAAPLPPDLTGFLRERGIAHHPA